MHQRLRPVVFDVLASVLLVLNDLVFKLVSTVSERYS